MIALAVLGKAIVEARLAYQFSPNSYTYGAFLGCLQAYDALNGPSWIDEYEDYRGTIETNE